MSRGSHVRLKKAGRRHALVVPLHRDIRRAPSPASCATLTSASRIPGHLGLLPRCAPLVVAAASPWTFGWDTLVACGTIALALATVILATNLSRGSVILLRGEQLHLRIRNGGKGPAFEIRCRLEPGGLGPEDWSSGILEQDQSEALRFSGSELEGSERFDLRLDYEDLAGRAHSSRIAIQLVAKKIGKEVKREYAFQEVDIS